MKFTTLLLIVLLFILSPFAIAQDYRETIEKTARFNQPSNPDNRLKIYNINGNVTVEGYDGDAIEITAVKKIDARRNKDLERGKEEVQLTVEEENDLILVYLDAPFIRLRRKGDRIHYRIDRHDEDYQFLFDITIKVPRQTGIHASTINRGRVTIRDIRSQTVTASNVNGEIELNTISANKSCLNTVNGNITAIYTSVPTEDSDFHTVNGKIEVNYPENLSADIRFKSLHGDLYTNFENIKRLRPHVDTKKHSDNSSTAYRIDKFTPVRIGNGGPQLSFRVLNGNVYVKKIKS